MLEIGNKAPDFCAPNQDDVEICSRDLDGKWIVLYFYPDDTAKHRKFIEKHDLSITLLADEDKKICEDYGVWQLKKFMGKEYMGVVRSTFIISPEGKIAAIWDKVSVRKKKTVKGEKIEILHVNEVKEKLQELQSN
jgi:peroxiredoxin Q/BCP